MNAADAPRFFPYRRVSTFEQSKGYSLTVQTQNLRHYYVDKLQPQGVEYADIPAEPGVSAYKLPFSTRPLGSQLWQSLRGGDYLAMNYMDRGFRDPIDALQTHRDCVRRGIHLISLDLPMSGMNTATDEAIFGLFAVFNRFISRLNAEKVRAARAEAQHKGKACGGPRPWGFLWWGAKGKKHLAPFELELFLISKAVRFRKQGLTLEATSERIRRLACTIEGKKYRHDRPISVGGRRWSIGVVRDACIQYEQDARLRELADQCADFWRPTQLAGNTAAAAQSASAQPAGVCP